MMMRAGRRIAYNPMRPDEEWPDGLAVVGCIESSKEAWPEICWKHWAVHRGAKDPVSHELACQCIVESCEQLPECDA